MKLNKIIILILIFVSAGVSAENYNVVFDSANAAYAKGKYENAIKLYEQILAADQESSALYFNLGNAYFKSNNLGSAILNYERAKKLDPNNEDLEENLKIANQRTEDKIEAAPQLFLSQWQSGITDIMSEKEWSTLLILLFIASLLLFSVYIASQGKVLKQLGFFGGFFVAALSVFSFFMAKSKYSNTVNSSSAIITSAAVTVTGSPTEKGTKLFILHEGTKVNITDQNEDWIEIKIANGNVGWIKSADLKEI